LIIPPANLFHPDRLCCHPLKVRCKRAHPSPPRSELFNYPMAQEEEVLGKAYDSRLMRRLLTYLRPYRWQVTLALASIVLKSFCVVLGPYLM
jgi:hypothetical protein